MFDTPKRPPVSAETTDEGANDSVVEINPMKYGDCFDPTGASRVRDVGDQWQMDTDNDGHKN